MRSEDRRRGESLVSPARRYIYSNISHDPPITYGNWRIKTLRSRDMRLITFIETFFARSVIYKELECSVIIGFCDCSTFFCCLDAASRSDIEHGDKRKSRRRGGEKNCRILAHAKSSTRRIHKFVRVIYGV
jgi:hypothetical protein